MYNNNINEFYRRFNNYVYIIYVNALSRLYVIMTEFMYLNRFIVIPIAAYINAVSITSMISIHYISVMHDNKFCYPKNSSEACSRLLLFL